jgi:hypothetical protein
MHTLDIRRPMGSVCVKMRPTQTAPTTEVTQPPEEPIVAEPGGRRVVELVKCGDIHNGVESTQGWQQMAKHSFENLRATRVIKRATINFWKTVRIEALVASHN